jgi:tetratricopeptide (TPR) repeat protein
MDAIDSFEALIREGLAASRAGRSQAALHLFAQASAVLPSSGIPHFLVGTEHAATGDTAAAEAAFANAVLLAPHFAPARYQLGLLQFCSNRPALALVTWDGLLALGPGWSLGHFVRGFAALAQDSFADSQRHFQAGLACGDLNPAMGGDIRQVVAAMQRLQASRERPLAEEPPAREAAAHVLLAAYGRSLH